MHISLRKELSPLHIVVIKVGSRILTAQKHLLRTRRIRTLVSDIVTLRKSGIRVVLVSSGAIAHGIRELSLSRRPATIPLKQACASIGQISLMEMYRRLFSQHGFSIGQVLLSWADLRDKTSYLNLRNTLFTLFEYNSIPIINENDSVGIEEIKIGDNDTLAAQISLLVGSDLFVNLTDTDGFHEANPKKKPEARHIPLVTKITPALHNLAEAEGTEGGIGGMVTKLRAAEIVCKSGIAAIIGNGYSSHLLRVLADESVGTLFLPGKQKMPSRRRWITFTSKPEGAVIVDTGAKKAIVKKGKSLLPVGIKGTSGMFNVGDMVDICDEKRRVFARGIVNYTVSDVNKIKGHRSTEIKRILGDNPFNLVIHRNNLVLL